MQQYLLLAPVLLPLLGGLPVFKMNERIPRRRYVTVLLVLELAALLVINWHADTVLPVLQLWGGARVVLGADALGRLFAQLVAALWLVVSVFADEYMTHEHNQARFFGFYVLSLGSLIGICMAANLVTLYLFYEMMTLLTVFLVIHTGTNKAIDAGIKYLGFSVCGAALGLLGMFYLQQYQTTDLFAAGGTLIAGAPMGQLRVALFVMLIGFGAKAGVMPLFAWLQIW
jgi:multicomponent Na+:H+ antiporter subunit D